MRVLILLYFTLLMSACTQDKVYVNRKADVDEGKAILDNFYSNIANKNYEDINNFVGDSLKKLSGIDGISKMIKFINNKVGNCKRYIVADQYIRCSTGTNNEVSYNYKLKVIYDKGTIDEIVGIIKHNGSEVKLNSYHANSDLLIH